MNKVVFDAIPSNPNPQGSRNYSTFKVNLNYQFQANVITAPWRRISSPKVCRKLWLLVLLRYYLLKSMWSVG